VTRVLAIVGLFAGCSVPALSLEGKQCPCTEGYVCDTLTNRCLATNDGGGIIDSPAATQGLPAIVGEAELYRYAGTFDWQTGAGTWAGNATEIQQSSTTTQDAFAYRTAAELTSAPDVRVIASMRPITNGSGTPSLGIVLRAQLGGAEVRADADAEAQRDAEREDRLDLARERVLGQAIVGHTPAQRAARLGSGVVHRHRITRPGEMVGARKTGRPRADDGDALVRTRAARNVMREAAGAGEVAQVPLDVMDGDGLVEARAVAGALAGMRADPAAHGRERVLLRELAPGRLGPVGLDQGEVRLDVLAGGTGRTAGRPLVRIHRAREAPVAGAVGGAAAGLEGEPAHEGASARGLA